MLTTGNYYFHSTITRVNLAAVLQALRSVADTPIEDIEADIGSLLSSSIAQGKDKAVALLLKYNLAYMNYAQNRVASHDGSIAFAQINWSIKALATNNNLPRAPQPKRRKQHPLFRAHA